MERMLLDIERASKIERLYLIPIARCPLPNAHDQLYKKDNDVGE